jgi:hypothetical protein
MTRMTTRPAKSAKALGTSSYDRSSGLISIVLLALAAQTVNASGKTPALVDQPKEIALALSACPVESRQRLRCTCWKRTATSKSETARTASQRLSANPDTDFE